MVRPECVREMIRLAEEDIASFEARMRAIAPVYQPGDRVLLHGEWFEIARYEPEGMPGYWLRSLGKHDLFLPLDLERELQPIVH
ncbi:MAG TPA: hypothetical protein VF173_16725 [Thermoanaerobaculia bacterium]|nr:hypothetical protein [Thermoanaerobaculia bacterium]